MRRAEQALRILVVVACAAAVGSLAGQGVPQVDLPAGQREAILEACRSEVAEDVVSDARSQGFGGYGADASLTETPSLSQKKEVVLIEGAGEFRYGAEYLWQPMTFTCEWDTRKGRIKKGSYRKAKGADITALPPERARAADACRNDIRRQVEDEARRRGYYSPSITLRPGIAFDDDREVWRLTGELSYELASVQDRATEAEFMCDWDGERGRLQRADLRLRSPWEREIGRVTCESRNLRRNTCQAPIAGRVRVYNRHSDAPCDLDRTWSYTSREIVVWEGCRATFEFEMR
jgi:hypothetical protein